MRRFVRVPILLLSLLAPAAASGQAPPATGAGDRQAATSTTQADVGGFAILSSDRAYQFRLRGLLQFDGRAFLGNQALAAGDTFVARRNVKLSANYERTWFTGGGGSAAAPGDRQTENVLLGRFQVAF